MPTSSRTSGGKTIQSVETALEILEHVRDADEAGVTEIADAMGRSKSTVHHYLSTLANYGYLRREEGRYRLGLQTLALGGTAREREQLYHLSKHDVDQLARTTGEKARLIVEQDGYGITLYQSSGEHVETTRTYVGCIEELYCTAAGKAFLAELSADEVDTYLSETDLQAHTDRTITDPDRLRAELSDIRSQGIAFDDEERYEGIRCVASAVLSGDGELLGALSISAPTERLSEERFRSELPESLQTTVGTVEINSSYSRWGEIL
jgi:DNA-binding IclR family transcriptional regulator